jgi:ferritin
MKINSTVYDLIKKQINIEFTNHAIYKELSNWCSFQGYNSAAELYSNQAAGELVHRDKFITFLLDAGYETPSLEINSHNTKADSLEKTIKLSLITEQTTTKELLAIKKACEDSGDYVTSSLLNWYLDEQVEEESMFIDLMDACTNIGLFDADSPEWAKKMMRQTIENRIDESLEDD